MPSPKRVFLAILVVLLLLPPSTCAFDTPLSSEAIREAYFLGQRRDDSLARFLGQYTRYLDPPRSGPHISSMTFFTPFALAVHSSSLHTAGYSAQQAEIDHRKHAESVRIIVQIQFTDSFGALIPAPAGSRSDAPRGYVLRPYDFWKDFDVSIFNSRSEDAQPLRPFSSGGEPNLSCGDNGGCTLTGATLYFDLLAKSFESGEAVVEVRPPEGDPVALEFDLASFR